ncbi:13759_t:CDS:2, partial [Racocetra fulgida]
MELDDDKDGEPSNSEYNTAEKDLDIYFEKIKDPYINRKSKAENFNEGEYETIEIIREDQIRAVIEKEYNEIIYKIEDETLQKSEWLFVQAKK